MSLLDKIRQESENPSVTVENRKDLLLEQLPEQRPEQQEREKGGDFESSLLAELDSLPKVSPKKVGVRLEEELLADIQSHCREEGITIETLLEAFFVICNSRESTMKQVTKEAKARIKQRTRAGNIRSTLTKFKNLQKSI
jgi:hypothetical protein